MSENGERAEVLFNEALDWLLANYETITNNLERDVVWTIQKKLNALIVEKKLPFVVFNDYPMLPGAHRSLSTDIAILHDEEVLLAVEFKYEPSHSRTDIPGSKLPVVFWGMDGIQKDIVRIGKFVTEGPAEIALAIFVDEGGAFSHRAPHPHSAWSPRVTGGLSVLRARTHRADGPTGPS